MSHSRHFVAAPLAAALLTTPAIAAPPEKHKVLGAGFHISASPFATNVIGAVAGCNDALWIASFRDGCLVIEGRGQGRGR